MPSSELGILPSTFEFDFTEFISQRSHSPAGADLPANASSLVTMRSTELGIPGLDVRPLEI